MEISEHQPGELEKAKQDLSDSINFVNKNNNRVRRPNNPPNKKKTEQMCFYCGGSYPHPAFGKECRGCGRAGHFKEVCRAKHTGIPSSFSRKERNIRKRINQMNVAETPYKQRAQSTPSVSSDSETDTVFVVEPQSTVVNQPTVIKTDASCVSTAKSTPQCRVKIHETNVKFLIDSGATINILDPRDFRAMSRRRNILLTPTRTKVKAFGSDRPIELSGKFGAVVETKKRMVVATFHKTRKWILAKLQHICGARASSFPQHANWSLLQKTKGGYKVEESAQDRNNTQSYSGRDAANTCGTWG